MTIFTVFNSIALWLISILLLLLVHNIIVGLRNISDILLSIYLRMPLESEVEGDDVVRPYGDPGVAKTYFSDDYPFGDGPSNN